MKAKYNDILETELIEKNPTIFLARYDYNLTRDALKLLRERYQGTAVIIPELDFKAKQGDIKGCNFFYKTALSNIIRELSNEDIIPMTQFISELFLSKGKLEDVNNTYEDSGFTNYPQRAINPKSWQHLRDQVKSYFLNIDLEVPFVVESEILNLKTKQFFESLIVSFLPRNSGFSLFTSQEIFASGVLTSWLTPLIHLP